MDNFKYLILCLFLISCTQKLTYTTCYDLQNYTREEQNELASILEKNNSVILNKFIIDYYNLRQDIKTCR